MPPVEAYRRRVRRLAFRACMLTWARLRALNAAPTHPLRQRCEAALLRMLDDLVRTLLVEHPTVLLALLGGRGGDLRADALEHFGRWMFYRAAAARRRGV